jgi:hypothetical protein
VRGPPVSACFDEAFLAPSWDRRGFLQSMRRWVPFGVQEKNRPKNIRFDLSALKGKSKAADDAIRRIYNSGEFVSPWAATTPDDEFPETFRYKVLADVKRPLAIRVPGKTQDISLRNFLASRVIKKKIDCLRELKLFSMQP